MELCLAGRDHRGSRVRESQRTGGGLTHPVPHQQQSPRCDAPSRYGPGTARVGHAFLVAERVRVREIDNDEGQPAASADHSPGQRNRSDLAARPDGAVVSARRASGQDHGSDVQPAWIASATSCTPSMPTASSRATRGTKGLPHDVEGAFGRPAELCGRDDPHHPPTLWKKAIAITAEGKVLSASTP